MASLLLQISPLLREALAAIPLRFDAWSHLFFLGIFLGLVLCGVLFNRPGRANQAPLFLGGFCLALSILLLDNWLCYTGLMAQVIWANDSTEFLTLTLGPFIYLFFSALLGKKPNRWWEISLHLMPALFYLLHKTFFFIQPLVVKYNAYIDAYHPDLPFLPYEITFSTDPLGLCQHLDWLILISTIGYIGWSLWKFGPKLWQYPGVQNWRGDGSKYHFSRNFFLWFVVVIGIVTAVFIRYDNDLGDHYISAMISLSLISTSIFVMNRSQVFQKAWMADKYDTSGSKNQDHRKILRQVDSYLQAEQYFLQAEASLKDLAARAELPAQYLSQAINQETGHNFNGYINQFRIRAAQTRLLDPAFQHLSIEGIGQSVGFKSKSAFYAAFKKESGLTPRAYLDSQRAKSG
ncbi:MAG: AraC family transcriptional regulator [Bacteroidota bacterium]